MRSAIILLALTLLAGCSSTPQPAFVACRLGTGQAFVAQTGTAIFGITPGGGLYLPEVDVMCPQPVQVVRPFVPAAAASAVTK